ncbi:MAG: class I SAM-dependent RNA methyltransferase [Clostridiales bacterium]|nr:class I SAM-dependent RNA methyltransferase [Clostridiales bacterium]
MNPSIHSNATGSAISGKIDGYNHEGMGVLRAGGRVIFVPGALTGEEAVVSLSGKQKGSVSWGQLLEIRNPSPHRIKPQCPYYMRCGGCQLSHASYAHQLVVKQSILERALAPLERLGMLNDALQLPVLPAHEPKYYRNKGIFAISRETAAGSPQVAIGFYARQSHVIASFGCPTLFTRQVNALIAAVARWLGDNTNEQPIPHHLLIRESDTTDDLTITLIGEEKPAWLQAFVAAFQGQRDRLDPQSWTLTGVGWLTSPAKKGPVVDGDPDTLWGSLGISETFVPSSDPMPIQPGALPTQKPLRFRFSPASFFQVNTRQTRVLDDEILRLCALTGNEILWDLYCGAGTISCCLASRAKAVLGIDMDETAIRDAWANARQNFGIAPPPFVSPLLTERLCFLAGAAERLVPALAQDPDSLLRTLHSQKRLYGAADKQAREALQPLSPPQAPSAALIRLLSEQSPDVIVLDPSSKGAKPAVLNAILSIRPEKIVYVSCDPATLARDLRILSAGKYAVRRIQPVDLFPQTAHIETIVVLTKQSS